MQTEKPTPKYNIWLKSSKGEIWGKFRGHLECGSAQPSLFLFPVWTTAQLFQVEMETFGPKNHHKMADFPKGFISKGWYMPVDENSITVHITKCWNIFIYWCFKLGLQYSCPFGHLSVPIRILHSNRGKGDWVNYTGIFKAQEFYQQFEIR